MNLSKYITLAEATKSQTATRLGIDNAPTAEHLDNMKHVAENVFDRVRENFKKPIAVTSFYRSPQLNKAIGGSTTSQHCNGSAIDMDGDVLGGVKNSEIFKYIKDNLTFDQLIWEFGNSAEPDWVHVSLVNGINRRKVTVAYRDGGKTMYKPYRG